MHAEIIAIGDELTSGQRLDTNSCWLSERLGELGVAVLYHTTVADDLQANRRVLREALDRSDIVITTGGLGPTADDLTRQAIAEATGTELLLDQGALDHIRRLFASRGREMPERNVVQAYFPAGSQIVPNPHGSAPGIAMQIARGARPAAWLFALPGVPAEMQEMWNGTLRDSIRAIVQGPLRLIRHRRVKCFGVGESDLEQMLPDLIQRGRQPQVGITVSKATITLRITAHGEDEAACLAAMEPTIDTIQQCLGDLVFGQEDDELQDAVVRQLQSTSATLSTCECDSGGLLARWLSEADAQATAYLGGIVIRSRPMAEQMSPEIKAALQRGDVPGESFVAALAASCRQQFDSDFALALGPVTSTDGFGEPSYTDLSAAVGPRVSMALATRNEVLAESKSPAGHPSIVLPRAVKQCLDLLRLYLLRRQRGE